MRDSDVRNAPLFKDEVAAREHLERLRWPNGPVCPHCGVEGGWKIDSERRKGLYKCVAYACGEQFTVTVKSIFERSKIPLTKWLMAVQFMCASKKGISSHQMSWMLGVTYKTALFMTYRIRLAMDGNIELPGNGVRMRHGH
jgi:transposase-like protein